MGIIRRAATRIMILSLVMTIVGVVAGIIGVLSIQQFRKKSLEGEIRVRGEIVLSDTFYNETYIDSLIEGSLIWIEEDVGTEKARSIPYGQIENEGEFSFWFAPPLDKEIRVYAENSLRKRFVNTTIIFRETDTFINLYANSQEIKEAFEPIEIKLKTPPIEADQKISWGDKPIKRWLKKDTAGIYGDNPLDRLYKIAGSVRNAPKGSRIAVNLRTGDGMWPQSRSSIDDKTGYWEGKICIRPSAQNYDVTIEAYVYQIEESKRKVLQIQNFVIHK